MPRVLLLVLALLVSLPARAVLTIEITRGVEAGIPIAIVPFEFTGSSRPQYEISDVIQADLARSGRFDPIPRQDFLNTPHDHTEVNFRDWRLIKSEALVVGRIQQQGASTYSVQFQLFDVFQGEQLAGYRYTIRADLVRKAAHQIADIIYETLTGEPGAFDTRIAYVTVRRQGDDREYLLQVADSDGFNAKTILQSDEPIMSPAWSPDGEQLAYVSFENKRSMVFVQRVKDGSRRRIAGYPGINSAPAWSPDGSRLALTLSRDGNPEIYILDLRNDSLRRITQHLAIDTEPSWSPDGRYLVFTSDRAGRPQIYRAPASGGAARRLTFEGNYNARASYSPDGDRLALVTNQGDGFRIGVFHVNDQALLTLTDPSLDESPSFAPNGRMILYATEKQGRGVLAAVSADGRVQQTLRTEEGDVREPAWSPFNSKL